MRSDIWWWDLKSSDCADCIWYHSHCKELILFLIYSIHEHSSLRWHHWWSCCCNYSYWYFSLLLLLSGRQGERLWDDVSSIHFSRERYIWRVSLSLSRNNIPSGKHRRKKEIKESVNFFLLSVSYPRGSHRFSLSMSSITRHLCGLWGRTQTFKPWKWISKSKSVKHIQLLDKQSPDCCSFLWVSTAVSVLTSLNHHEALYSEFSLQDRNLLFILMMETDHWKKSGMSKDTAVTLSLHTCYGKKSSSHTSCIPSRTHFMEFSLIHFQVSLEQSETILTQNLFVKFLAGFN